LKFQATAEKTAKILGGYFLPHPVYLLFYYIYVINDFRHIDEFKMIRLQHSNAFAKVLAIFQFFVNDFTPC